MGGVVGERAAAWIPVPFSAPSLQTARMALSAIGRGNSAVRQGQILKRSMRLFTANEPGTCQKLATSSDPIRKPFPPAVPRLAKGSDRRSNYAAKTKKTAD